MTQVGMARVVSAMVALCPYVYDDVTFVYDDVTQDGMARVVFAMVALCPARKLHRTSRHLLL